MACPLPETSTDLVLRRLPDPSLTSTVVRVPPSKLSALVVTSIISNVPSPSLSVLTVEIKPSLLVTVWYFFNSDPLADRCSTVLVRLPSALITVTLETMRSLILSPSSSNSSVTLRPLSLMVVMVWLRSLPSALSTSTVRIRLPSSFNCVVFVMISSACRSPSRSMLVIVSKPLALLLMTVCETTVPSGL